MNGLLDEKQAASYLHLSVALLRKWRTYGDGPAFVKIGRLVRYRQLDLDAYVEGHLVSQNVLPSQIGGSANERV